MSDFVSHLTNPNLTLAQGFFLKLLALTYFFAFLSLHNQVLGLFGSKGIVSAESLLKRIKMSLPKRRWAYIPTILHINAEDRTLRILTALGIGVSLIAFLGVVPTIAFFTLWLLYLSFVLVGAPFLQFQWDYLLLEVGFLAIWVSIMTPPPVFLMIALWVLLFRLILSSGFVKCLSGCPEWRSLNALRYHFETQPLPNIGGYFAHHLFMPITKYLCAFVIFLELVPPFLFLGNEWMRFVGGILALLLQFMIIVTGNYAFFNLLTIALIVSLFSNEYLSWIPSWLLEFQAFQPNEILALILNFVGALFVFFNIISLIKQLRPFKVFEKIFFYLNHWAIINHYGLFAVMTTVRDELIFEGSDDGIHWKEYLFKYKPQILKDAPRQIAPLQPRLDWQLWFVPLGGRHPDWWVDLLMQRLKENSPAVIALFANNPFPASPPRYIRIQSYHYHFSSLKDWEEKRVYWTRTYNGLYK